MTPSYRPRDSGHSDNAATIWVAHYALFSIVLAAIALAAPLPWWGGDRNTYEQIGRELIIPGCSELHCSRVLVPWIIESLPGPSLVKWKLFAAMCEAGAGIAMGHLAGRFGLSRRAAFMVAWMSAFGAGATYTLFDAHTADPLVHLLVPVTTILLMDERLAAAGAVAAVGVFAKEFAAVPLWVVAIARALEGRWTAAREIASIAFGVTVLWAGWQVFLQVMFGYNYGGSHSVDLLGGGYVVFWLLNMGPRLIILSIFIVFGAAYVLWPFGLAWSGEDLKRMTFAAAPIALMFAAVQQPDRALWNFAFLVLPAAGFVLQRAPAPLAWTTVATFAVANLRYGAQLPVGPVARVALAASCLLAIGCVWAARPSRPW